MHLMLLLLHVKMQYFILIRSFFFFFFPGRDQYYSRLIFVGFVFPGAPEGSTGRELFLEKPGIESATPGLQGE